MWKTKNKRNINSYNSLNPLTSRSIDYKNIEEVYKLDFSSHSLSDRNLLKKNESINTKANKNAQDFFQLYKSIERVKKFVPNLSDLLDITHTKKLEKKLIKRFENQETEKIMKGDLKQITDKHNKIKKSISDNFLTFQKLDKQISDIKLSLYVHSKMEQKPILLTPNNMLKSNNMLSEKRTFSENNIRKNNKEKINKEDRAKEIKLDFERRLKILNQRLNKKKQEIIEMRKILPKLELNKKEIISKLKMLEKEKKENAIIKNNISEKLYFHYLNILKEGSDTRNHGFSNLVKEIFELDKRVLLSYFPDYLDLESIKYLLHQAKLKFQLEQKNNEIKKLKNYFSETIFNKKKKKLAEKKDNIKKAEDEIVENNGDEKISEDILLNFSPKKSLKTNRNRYNNLFWNTNGFSKLDSTKTNFTNVNIDKNLSNSEMSFNKSEKDKINFNINDYKINNKINTTTTDLKLSSVPKDKTANKNKTKHNFYKKLLLNHKFLNNSPLPNKKINLSNFSSIPEVLSVTQVEDYLKTRENLINDKNINKVIDFFELDKKIKKINNKLVENKKNELQRIFEKYLDREYSQKFIFEKEKVLSALIGEDNVQPELRKQIRKTKLFYENIKKCGLINNQTSKEYKVNQISHSFLKKMGNY